LNSADFGIADTYVGSSASFIRFLYQNSSYHPIKRRFSFCAIVSYRVLAPYRDTLSLNISRPDSGAAATAYSTTGKIFAGGGTQLRGFALNQAGRAIPKRAFQLADRRCWSSIRNSAFRCDCLTLAIV